MAISTVTITLTNTKQNPTVVSGSYKPIVVISPTPITTPVTPYDEYVADSQTIMDGTISVPAWKKVQYFNLPAGCQFAIQTDNYDEVWYYENLKVEGLSVKVSPDPITIIGVTLDKTFAPVIVGGSGVSFTATTTPAGQTVTWTSSDETVATVSDGTVTGVSVGTATITATITVDGVTASASATVSCTQS